ncbi:MAG: CPBP family intramembrane glutamic endopeptidase [Pyrinomonadaceae bacterium]
MTTLRATHAPYTYFNPTREMPANWIYSFGLWLFLWLFTKIVFLIQFHFWPSYPASQAANILLLYSPLPAQLLSLIAIAVYATAIGNYRLNQSLKWSNAEPITIRFARLNLQPSPITTAAFCTAAGLGLYCLAHCLYTSIGGPVTQAEEFAAKFPETMPYMAATAVLSAPVSEELLYRGVLFIQAHGKARKLVAILISGAAFTVVHVPQYSSDAGQIHWGAISSIAVLGLACGLCRALLDRVWPAFVIHTAYNACVAAVYFATRM